MSMREEMRKHLAEGIVPFWQNLEDEENGGFYGYMGPDLAVDKKAEKGCILNSRILWFFSNAAMSLEDKNLLKDAEHAYRFMMDYCMDKEYGGVYWSVSYDGKPEDTTKHIYNQAFAVYALSSYFDASGDVEALQTAFELFNIIEEKGFDEGGYKEALDRTFAPAENDKLSENGVMADRTMNTLLHVFEAYTELYRVSKDERVKTKLLWILETFRNKIYNPKLHRQEVFFDNDMNSIIDLHSYGHDIETAWLLDRGLDVIGDKEYAKEWDAIVADLIAQVYKVAYYNNSFSNECERGVVDKKRVWWVQAEAVVGFFNEYQKHPDHKEYLDAAFNIWGFIKEFVIDKRNGSEWFMHVDDKGAPETDKPIVEPWKCPYHNGRMCMEIMRRTK
ncbi:MAG: AGE family epimerase/isomerase [Lachnospiraceae bacterium]|nr:AGE family epimerase/isomerase [Lachnospiraceae bacterium]MBQ7780986.1 AGE family epimerase/isomerase [Lachnospiraceae bacterium]